MVNEAVPYPRLAVEGMKRLIPPALAPCDYHVPVCVAIGVPAGVGPEDVAGDGVAPGAADPAWPRVSSASAETGTSRTISSSSDNLGTGRPPTVIARA